MRCHGGHLSVHPGCAERLACARHAKGCSGGGRSPASESRGSPVGPGRCAAGSDPQSWGSSGQHAAVAGVVRRPRSLGRAVGLDAESEQMEKRGGMDIVLGDPWKQW